jgi:hypothetical protein
MTRADTEIPWHQKRIDLAFLSPRAEVGAVAIELKVDDTARAIDQATLNRYLTPSSWVATWTGPSPKVLASAESAGVGVLLIAERGVYPLVYPRLGERRTDALIVHLNETPRRVRDLLSELRRG